MKCPYCKNDLEDSDRTINHIVYYCNVQECMLDDMARFTEIRSLNPPALISRQFIFHDNVCINISYLNNTTTISKMIAYFLVDSFEVPRAMEIDMDDPYSSLPKIKTLMTFS